MRTAALLIVASLAVGGPAFAAERSPVSPASECQPVEKFKAAFGAAAQFSAATIDEYHVLKGVYLGNPKTPEGNPPGDGALIVTRAHGPVSIIAWTRDNGKSVCGDIKTVLLIPAAVMALIGHTETGAGETKDPDESKDEMRL